MYGIKHCGRLTTGNIDALVRLGMSDFAGEVIELVGQDAYNNMLKDGLGKPEIIEVLRNELRNPHQQVATPAVSVTETSQTFRSGKDRSVGSD